VLSYVRYMQAMFGTKFSYIMGDVYHFSLRMNVFFSLEVQYCTSRAMWQLLHISPLNSGKSMLGNLDFQQENGQHMVNFKRKICENI
jgi:hypothetical protein